MNQPTAGLMLVAQVHHPNGRTVRQAIANGGGLKPVEDSGPLLVVLPDSLWIQSAKSEHSLTWQVPIRSPDFAPEVFQKLLAVRVGWLNPHTYRAAEAAHSTQAGLFYLAHPSKGARYDHVWRVSEELLVAEVSTYAAPARGPTAAPRLSLHRWTVRPTLSDVGLPGLTVSQTSLKSCRISRQETSWCTGEGSELALYAVRKAGLKL